MTPQQLERLVDANADALGLRIDPGHRPGVIRCVALAAAMAELLDGLPLEPSDESGNVFVPVEPGVE